MGAGQAGNWYLCVRRSWGQEWIRDAGGRKQAVQAFSGLETTVRAVILYTLPLKGDSEGLRGLW